MRAVRRELGISQDDLAHRADLDRSYMGRIERDEVSPSLDTIRAVAKGLKVRPSQLLERMER